jgi:hypothetical protein
MAKPSSLKRDARTGRFMVGRVFRSGPQDRHVFRNFTAADGETITVLDERVHKRALKAVRGKQERDNRRERAKLG